MFGLFRFVLASLVVLYHFSNRHPVGWYAVYAFYALSGYLMTLVINKKYSLSIDGILSFEFNRILRIYPPYLVVLLSSIALMRLPSFASFAPVITHNEMGNPATGLIWFRNSNQNL